MNHATLLLSLFLLFNIFAYAPHAKTLHVKYFNAIPNDQIDDTTAINQALKACKSGDRLLFDNGTYDLYDSISINQKENLDINGNGAVLMLRGFDRSKGGPTFSAISLTSSEQVTIQNFTVDMDVSPNSAGVITNVGDLFFDVKVFDEFPLTDDLFVDHIMTFYPDGRPNGSNLDMYSDFSVDKIADDVLRIHLRQQKQVRVGEWLCLYHKVYGGQAIYFGDTNNCSLLDVTIRSFAGMGFVASDRTRNLTLKRYKVKRPEGTKRLTSTNADGSKFILTGGLLTIEDCEYEGMGDDAINIHSSFAQITSIKRNNNSFQLMSPHRNGIRKLSDRYLLPGDKIEIYDSKTLLPKGVSTIVQINEDWFEVDVIPEGVTENDLLNNITMTPRVRISGVSVSRNRARGFLLQSQDVVVENCRIINPTGVGIFVTTDVNYWYESGPGKNIIIRNNTIEGANNHLIREGAITVKCSHDSGGTDYPAGVHRNIKITGNTIRNTASSGIFVNATEDIVVTGNTIENCSLTNKLPNSEYAIFLKNCKNITISDNTVIDGKKEYGSEGFE